MFPVHIEGINENPQSEFYNSRWTIDLIAVPMESVREWFKFNRKDTPESRQNLQVWVNNQGEALYNPVWWRLIFRGNSINPNHQLKSYNRRRGGRFPHRQHSHIERQHGTHRIRALEALDANFVYVYFEAGVHHRIPRDQEKRQMRRNERPPITSTTSDVCDKCGKGVRWEGGRDLTKSTFYTCKTCGHKGSRPPVYPEPM